MRENNYKTRLVDYFKKNLSKGYSSDSLKFSLISQGYSRTAVEKAIEQAHREFTEENKKSREKPKIKYEIFDEHDKPIVIKKSWWKKFFRL